jgi:hypothetical protein
MKKLFFGAALSAFVIVVIIPTTARAMAGGEVGVRVALPPPIVFAGPPEVVVIPETYVYAVPDVEVDIFFYDGWWWRPWQGRWYRSQHYNSGWAYYQSVPAFYGGIPPGWRNDYRDHRWRGHRWNHQRIPHQQLQRNWNNWEKNRHWEKQQTWGVQGLQPRTRSQQPPRGEQPRQSQPQLREDRPERSQQQYREGQPQHSQPQYREAPRKYKPQKGKQGRGEEEKDRQDRQDRYDRQDRQ